MKQDEAERLARNVLCAHHDPNHPDWMSMGALSDAAMKLANYILSGDHKREIENAAFERAMKAVRKCKAHEGESEIIRDCVEAIRALIHPPAQKENGE